MFPYILQHWKLENDADGYLRRSLATCVMPQSSQQASAVVFLGIMRLGRVLREHVHVCVRPQVLVASLALCGRLPGLLSASQAWT